MSRNSEAPGIDRRARRTRELLGQALIDLGAVRNIDELDVGDLIAQAGIGRSTFYTHYASKEDFLATSFVNLIAMMEAAVAAKYPDRTDIIPSAPLFAHVHEAQDFVRKLVQSEALPRQMAAGEAKLRTIAEANLTRRMPHWSPERRREAAVYIAGGFMGMLRWWMESGLRKTPQQMQTAFDALTRSVLAD